MLLRRCPCTPAIAAVADLAMARPCSGRVSKFGGESDGFNAVADVLGARPRIPISLFRTIQDTLKYLPRGLRYCLNPEDAVKMVGDMSMSTCWACGGAPPSWSFVCEECGGRGISSKSEHERMEKLERDYFRGSMGQYSNPFRSRSPQLGFIAPAIPNPILFCG